MPQFAASVLRVAAPLLDHAAALMVTLGHQGFMVSVCVVFLIPAASANILAQGKKVVI